VKQIARRESAPSSPSLLDGLFRRLRDLAGGGENGGLRETLEELIEDSNEEVGPAAFTPEQRTLLLNALSFGELRVDDVMVPRTEIEAIAAEAGLPDVIKAMRNGKHTRLIVYRETLDDVLGIVHLKDLLDFWGDGESFHLEAVVRPVLVVPPSMRIIDLLLEMRDSKMNLAIVVDEFGGTDGLVTIEDLVEELVGELQERTGHSSNSSRIVLLPGGVADVDARIDLEELERDLGFEFLSDAERDDADTLAGLLVSLVDRVPQAGEVVDHASGLRFEVTDGDPRRVTRVRISGLPEPRATGREPAPLF
jgi:magnesium and cobalt transporter